MYSAPKLILFVAPHHAIKQAPTKNSNTVTPTSADTPVHPGPARHVPGLNWTAPEPPASDTKGHQRTSRQGINHWQGVTDGK